MAQIIHFTEYMSKLNNKQIKFVSTTGKRNDKLMKKIMKLVEWDCNLPKKRRTKEG